jgi:hypothetical protein
MLYRFLTDRLLLGYSFGTGLINEFDPPGSSISCPSLAMAQGQGPPLTLLPMTVADCC